MTRTHSRSLLSSFAWKLRIFPKGSELRYILQDLRRTYRPWNKLPKGWRHTSHIVSRIYGKVHVPQFHKPIFKLLKNKRKN